jgi:hypothetical protein
VTAKLKSVKGEGKRTVKWSHGKYPPLKPGGPVRIDAVAPRKPYVLRWELYTKEKP